MAAKKRASSTLARSGEELAQIALAYPGATEENPWGERAFKVNKKTFVFLGGDAKRLGISTKLPHSSTVALELPFAEPTHYGLGKSGWVSASFEEGAEVPVGLLKEWIDESYRAIAPKKMVAALAGALEARPAAAPVAKTTARKPAKKGAAPRSSRAQGPVRRKTSAKTGARKK